MRPLLNLELTASQRAFRDEVREFAEREVQPAAAAAEPYSEFPRKLLPRLAEMGLTGIAVPREYGGRGLDTVSACLAIRELAVACASTAVTVHVNNFVYCAPLLRCGSEEQKQAFLVPAAAGRLLGAFALSEPDAGSDPSRISAEARPAGDGYLVSGRKAWVTNGTLASSYLVVARVNRGGPGGETAIFIVDGQTPGLEIGPLERTLGLRSARVTGISLERCFVPGACLLGDENRGLKLALDTLRASRIGVAAQSIGIARAALGLAGLRRGDPETGQELAAAAARVEAGNLMMLRAAWLVDQDPPGPVCEASMAKLFCSEAAVSAAETALAHSEPEAMGEGHPSSRYWRDARVTTIYGGPSEIQRGLIARQLLHPGE